MNKVRSLIFLISTLTIWSCSEQPYEKVISNYFQENAKVVPIIEEIKVDTTASMESYKGYWTKRIEERKQFLISSLERENKYAKEGYERANESFKKFPKDWRERMEEAKDKMKETQNKLDNANKGNLDDIRYTKMNRYKDDKSNFKQLTVKYQLSEDGATLIQKFVVQNDSVVYPTDRNLDFFISFFFTKTTE